MHHFILRSKSIQVLIDINHMLTVNEGCRIHNHKFIGAMLLSPKLDKVLGQRIWFLEALEKELHERLSGDIIKIGV